METAELFRRLKHAEERVQADAEQVARLEKLTADFEHHAMESWADQACKLLTSFEQMRVPHVAERDALRADFERLRA